MPTDEELVRRLVGSRGEEAVRDLYRSYAGEIFGFAFGAGPLPNPGGSGFGLTHNDASANCRAARP